MRLAPQRRVILGRQSGDVPVQTVARGDHRQFFQLPLIDRDRGALYAFQKLGGGHSLAQHVRKLGRARAFRAGGGEEDGASRFHDVRGRGDALDALVIRQVERVSGRGW